MAHFGLRYFAQLRSKYKGVFWRVEIAERDRNINVKYGFRLVAGDSVYYLDEDGSWQLSDSRTSSFSSATFRDLSLTLDTSDELLPYFVEQLSQFFFHLSQNLKVQKTEDFLFALARALEHYGGVSHIVVPDNLKAAVIKADK